MPPREIDFAKLTVLVVEDQEYIRKLIVQLLKKLGCASVIEAGDGEEGLQVLSRSTPDLVICDIKMEPVDGLTLLHKVRAGEGVRNAQIPIIFLTSDSERETVVQAIQAEVDGYMVKPVSPADLKAKITAVLSKRLSAASMPWK
jgi:two-component system chemotaxis response regulator CheY